MKRSTKITIALAVAAVYVLAGAPAANAHTSAVTGTATCETDGTYTVVWTYNASNVPDGVEAETKAMTASPASTLEPIDGVSKGGQVFLSVWTEHQINVPGAPVRTGNWSASFEQTGIAGTSTVATTMVQTDWKGGPSEDPIGEVTIDGTCAPEIPVKPEPVVQEASSETVDCDTRTVVTRHTVTTTDYVLVDNVWVLGEPVTTPGANDGKTRPATEQECPVVSPPTEEPTPPTEEPSEEPKPPTETPVPPVEPPTDDRPADAEPSNAREGLAVTGPVEDYFIGGSVLAAVLLLLGGLAYTANRKKARNV